MKWAITLEDGRTLDVHAGSEALARAQATHAERTRFVIAIKRGHESEPDPSAPVACVKVKD